jgi:hypothetical protein
MSDDIYPLKLPESIKVAAIRLAKADGISLDEWITAVVAEKVDAVETVAAFLKRRSGTAGENDLARALARVPDVVPMEGDELPDHLR